MHACGVTGSLKHVERGREMQMEGREQLKFDLLGAEENRGYQVQTGRNAEEERQTETNIERMGERER
jgi:hypothetical protein